MELLMLLALTFLQEHHGEGQCWAAMTTVINFQFNKSKKTDAFSVFGIQKENRMSAFRFSISVFKTNDPKVDRAFSLSAVGDRNIFITCLPDPHCCPWWQEVLLGLQGQTGQYRPWTWKRSQWASVVLAPWLNVHHRQRGLTRVHLELGRYPVVTETTKCEHLLQQVKDRISAMLAL